MTQISNQSTCCDPLESLLEPDFFKALADPNRVAILARLAQGCGAQTVSEVAACCPVDLSVVSRHLAILRRAGILTSEKQGKQVRYHVRFHVLAQTLRTIADAIDACCPPEPTEGENHGS